MKKTLTIIAFALGSTAAFSQQDPQFSQYMYNKLFMNPGYSGMRQALCFTAIARQQWAGFDGAPKSGVFSADCFLPKIRGGVGINIMYDQLGFENNMGYRLNYSYHQPLGGGILGIGLEFGAFSKRLGPTGTQAWLATSNWQNDQSIPPQLKKTVFDMGFGLWYQRQNLWFGISSTHLPASSLSGQSSSMIVLPNPTPQTFSLTYQIARHYFVTGGYNWNINGGAWELRPSLLVKSDATITSFDLNVTALYNQRFWFGASYRFQDAICPMIGFMLPQAKATSNEMPGGGLKVGFAYDYTTSNLKNYNSGTFELLLNYCIPIVIPVHRQGHGDVRIFD
ncbi:MAG: type IX secretion system membrane protein PorP/SprF [Bacteroidetes bacterium]|nr:type IX secretion system membrane protein PorP/SprF [Bacteroidota bacterium]